MQLNCRSPCWYNCCTWQSWRSRMQRTDAVVCDVIGGRIRSARSKLDAGVHMAINPHFPLLDYAIHTHPLCYSMLCTRFVREKLQQFTTSCSWVQRRVCSFGLLSQMLGADGEIMNTLACVCNCNVSYIVKVRSKSAAVVTYFANGAFK